MSTRKLNIGGGAIVLRGFEVLNLGDGERTRGAAPDHVADCRKLPFPDNTFAVVHASHIIEHVQWYQVSDTIREWFRVVAPGGQLEVWAPDGYKLAQAIVRHEETGESIIPKKTLAWRHDLTRGDIIQHCAARLMNCPHRGEYDAQIHRAILTPKLLMRCMAAAGARESRRMEDRERRDHDHGWINMGVIGWK